MTPSYASPEQLRGESITTASDVYSLGVILYKLLCGSLPLPSTGDCHFDLESAIFDREIENPSRCVLERHVKDAGDLGRSAVSRQRRTTPNELSRRIRGDLDAIVLKALRQLPEQRYVSIEELSSDVGRHLAGIPVRARSGARRYRTARLFRRVFLPQESRRKRERLLWAGLLVAALIASWIVPAWRRLRISGGDALGTATN